MDWLPSVKVVLQKVATFPMMTQERLYWIYLLTSLFLAAFIYLFHKRDDKSLRVLFSFLFPKEIYKHPSAWIDFKYMFVNKLLKIAYLAPFQLLYPWFSTKSSLILEGLLGPAPSIDVKPSLFILILYTILSTTCFDLSLYVGHLLQHKIKFLWEFHKVHHSAEVLYPVTVHRVHPVDDILNVGLITGSTGILSGVFHYWFPGGIQVLSYWQLNIVVFGFYFLGYNLRHSHVWLSYGKLVSHVFMSPAQHQIHHSKNPRHFDKNMGFMLSFWDWIFGTLHVPQEREQNELEFGLGHVADEENFRSVWGLYTHPFRRVFARWIRKT